MALTDETRAISLTQDDIAKAMELSCEAGWNQLPDDWRLFLAQGRVFGLFEEATLAATAAVMPYGSNIAWISMVLTRKAFRGRGFGTALLRHCIAEIEREGHTAFLDATPAGEPIYRNLGFEPGERFERWQGSGGARKPTLAQPAPDFAIEAANVAFGADRSFLLRDFIRRSPKTFRSMGTAHAFGRDGRLATQIGPVVGDDEGTVIELVEAIIASLEGPVFLDVAAHCTGLAAHLKAAGFNKQRPFLRMKKGPHDWPDSPAASAVIAGPEFG